MNILADFNTNSMLFKSTLLGFCAQMVGSSLGMAYSVTCSSVLLAMGISPAMASATVHTSEVANRLFSGMSHLRFGNVDRGIFKQLALFGMAGALCGALVVTTLPVDILRPVVSGMLLLMGVRILFMAWGTKPQQQQKKTSLAGLGFIGGVVDVIGGGGWGPVVTSTLMLRGTATHLVIGSINFAKFFVAIVESAALILLLKSPRWDIILGLICGGVLAAPLAAWSCRKTPPRVLAMLVGILVCSLSIRNLIKALV